MRTVPAVSLPGGGSGGGGRVRFYVGAAMADMFTARKLAGHLQALGHGCTFPWFDLADTAEAWTGERRALIAEKEIEGVRSADVLVLIAPGGRGMHAELGAALALRKPVILCGRPKFCLFYYHELVIRLDAPEGWCEHDVADAMRTVTQ